MAKKQCTKEKTVKNVRQYIGCFDMQTRYAIQQFLQWFNVDRKLERIIWAILRKSEITRQKEAEVLGRERQRELAAKAEGRPYHPDRRIVREPDKITLIVDFCPKCGSPMVGMPVRSCRQNSSYFGAPVFYKECSACTHYIEIFKKKNKYIEVGGG